LKNWFCFLFLAIGITIPIDLLAQSAIEIVQPKAFPVRVAVKLMDLNTGKPVPYATIRFSGTKRGLTADSNGFFSVVITQRDTLRISSIGYYDMQYTKDPARQTSYYITLGMVSKIYELDAVQIFARRSKDLNNPMLRWEYKARFMPKVWLFHTPTGEPPEPPSLMSPISFLYDKYSRRGKAARKLRDMVAERARKRANAQRFNIEKVKQWTGLEDVEIEDFMRFCPMPDGFLETATEYEIIEKTFRCLEDFDSRELRPEVQR